MDVRWISPKNIKINPNNPRVIKDDKYHKLVKSIREFPKMLEIRPIVVNKDFIVLGGNMRTKACIEAGLETVPVIFADDLTDDQQREFIIKDNVGFGEWDWDMIANEWDLEKLSDWGMDLPEFKSTVEAQEDNYEIPDEVQTDIQPGDLFQIGPHRLLCGDSTKATDADRLMKKEQADMVMTDPPYNVDYEGGTGMKIMNDKMGNSAFFQFLFDFYTTFAAVTKPGGSWYVWHADSEGVNFRTAFEKSGLLLKQCLIWVKNTFVMGRQDYHWKHEPCLYGWKPGAAHYFTNSRSESTVIEDKIDPKKLTKAELQVIVEEMLSERVPTTVIRGDKPQKNDLHPTMKPIKLLGPLIQNSSQKQQIVCDPFLGSGSTMVACHQLDRKCYGMELDPKYCQVIIERMLLLDPTLKITKNGKKYAIPETNPEVA